MRRQVTSLVFLCLCAVSSLFAQSVQLNTRQDIQTNATRLTGLALADFNGDGKLDIVVTDNYSQTVSVYLNDGTDKFGTPVTSSFTLPSVSGFGPLVAGDVNEDGKQDLIVGPSSQNQLDAVLLGNGDGTFTEKGQTTISNGFSDAALVDINGDKHLDVIAGSNCCLSVALGDGTGNFTPQSSPITFLPLGDFFPGVTVGDFNGDNIPDFAVIAYRNSQILYFAGKNDGTFQPASTVLQTSPPVGSSRLYMPYSIASADFNSDGKRDLLVGSRDFATVTLGNGDGTFPIASFAYLPLPQPLPANLNTIITPIVAATDINNDGIIDVVAVDDGSQTLNVLLNDGTGRFSRSVSVAADYGSNAMKVADLDGDGLQDVVLINFLTQKISIFRSTSKTTPTVSVQSSATQALVGTPIAITVQVTSSGSHTPTGMVTLASGATSFGQQTLDASGQASFTLPSLVAGQYLLNASYAGDTYNNRASNNTSFTQNSTDFQLSLPSSAQTVAIGAAATYNLTLTPQAGFTGSIAFSCTGLPAGYTCSAPAASINGQAANAAIVVSLPASASESPTRQLLFHSGATTFLAFCGFCFYSRRKRISQLVLSLAVLITLGTALGCSGAASSGSSGTKPSGYTGTSNFTITATTTQGAITVSHQALAMLTVQ